MPPPPSPIRNISDTACWSALYRARETERPSPLFRDPFARQLAGPRGEQIAAATPFSDKNTWSWVTRTWLFDHFIEHCIARGAATVVNLAAGLDARPYRMPLPPALRWFEIDLPDILDYKTQILADSKPVCSLERIPLDLADAAASRSVFDRIAATARNAVIISEGFLIYLTTDQVVALAQSLAATPPFQSWIIDLASPGLLRLLQKHLNPQLTPASAPFQFAPPQGPPFFTPYGWNPIQVRNLLKTAAGFHRLSLPMRLLSLLPASNGAQGRRPWGGVCLLERSQSQTRA